MTTRPCLLQHVKIIQWVRKTVELPAHSHSLTSLLGILGKECHSGPAAGLPRAGTINIQMMIKTPQPLRKCYLPFSRVAPGSVSAQNVGGTGSWPSSVSCLNLYCHFAARINSPCFCSHVVVQWTALWVFRTASRSTCTAWRGCSCLCFLIIFFSS